MAIGSMNVSNNSKIDNEIKALQNKDKDIETTLSTKQTEFSTFIADLTDTSIYDENTWYPCYTVNRINSFHGFAWFICSTGNAPGGSWATLRGNNYTCNYVVLTSFSDWNTFIDQNRIIVLDNRFWYVSDKKSPVVFPHQTTHSARYCVYLRGGGLYYLSTPNKTDWIIYTEDVTLDDVSRPLYVGNPPGFVTANHTVGVISKYANSVGDGSANYTYSKIKSLEDRIAALENK